MGWQLSQLYDNPTPEMFHLPIHVPEVITNLQALYPLALIAVVLRNFLSLLLCM
jgi:hypothetical protein